MKNQKSTPALIKSQNKVRSRPYDSIIKLKPVKRGIKTSKNLRKSQKEKTRAFNENKAKKSKKKEANRKKRRVFSSKSHGRRLSYQKSKSGGQISRGTRRRQRVAVARSKTQRSLWKRPREPESLIRIVKRSQKSLRRSRKDDDLIKLVEHFQGESPIVIGKNQKI